MKIDQEKHDPLIPATVLCVCVCVLINMNGVSNFVSYYICKVLCDFFYPQISTYVEKHIMKIDTCYE